MARVLAAAPLLHLVEHQPRGRTGVAGDKSGAGWRLSRAAVLPKGKPIAVGAYSAGMTSFDGSRRLPLVLVRS